MNWTHVRKHVCWLVIRLCSCNTYDRRARLITSTVHSNAIEIISRMSQFTFIQIPYTDERWAFFFLNLYLFHYANDELLCQDELVCEHSNIEHWALIIRIKYKSKYTFKCVLVIWMKYEIAWSYMIHECSMFIYIYSPLFFFCALFALCSLFEWNQMYEKMSLFLSFNILFGVRMHAAHESRPNTKLCTKFAAAL